MSLFRAISGQADGRNPSDLNPGSLNPSDRNLNQRAADHQRNADPRTAGGLDPNGRSAGREPYRINRVPEDRITGEPIPDGPTQRIAKPAGRGGRRTGNVFVLVVAMLALNLAGVAGLFAWRAFGLARATAGAGGHVAPVNRGDGASYSVAYAQEPLRVQVGCPAVMFLDLDEPRANAPENVGDLQYDSRCGTPPPSLALGPGAISGARVTGGDIDAAGCGEAIRTSPLGPGASVVVTKGVTLCVLTGAEPPAMVLVEVTEVGPTGTAGMRATSWKVTG